MSSPTAPATPPKYCSACGTLAQTEKIFCPECGTQYGALGGGRADVLSYGAFVCAAVSLLFFPIVFGPIAIVLSSIALGRKEPHAALALGLSIAGMILGFILGALVLL